MRLVEGIWFEDAKAGGLSALGSQPISAIVGLSAEPQGQSNPNS